MVSEEISTLFSTRRWVLWVNRGQDPQSEGGFVPSVAFENHPFHYPLIGDAAKLQAPYIFGKTYDEAQALADRLNEERGISRVLAAEIVLSGIAAARR